MIIKIQAVSKKVEIHGFRNFRSMKCKPSKLWCYVFIKISTILLPLAKKGI